ncbi:MAG: hypothetical protein R3F14_29940 [Polyangiaceae bacterium]
MAVPVTLETPPFADPVELTVESDGQVALTGQFYPYDHLPAAWCCGRRRTDEAE